MSTRDQYTELNLTRKEVKNALYRHLLETVNTTPLVGLMVRENTEYLLTRIEKLKQVETLIKELQEVDRL